MIARRGKKGNLYYCKTEVRKRPYTEDDLVLIRRLVAMDWSASRIAAEIGGRSPGSVAGAVRRLGLTTNGGPGGAPHHRRNQHAVSREVV